MGVQILGTLGCLKKWNNVITLRKLRLSLLKIACCDIFLRAKMEVAGCYLCVQCTRDSKAERALLTHSQCSCLNEFLTIMK